MMPNLKFKLGEHVVAREYNIDDDILVVSELFAVAQRIKMESLCIRVSKISTVERERFKTLTNYVDLMAEKLWVSS